MSIGYFIVAPDISSLWQEALSIPDACLRNSLTGAWIAIPSSGLSNTGNSGACGVWHPHGPIGTTSAATATTITTDLSPLRSLSGITIRLTGGAGAGQERVITSNTIGANSVITVPAWDVQPDATTTWLLLSGRYYVLAGGASPSMKYFDPVTWSWSSALAGPAISLGNEGMLAATCYTVFLSGQVVTSATGTTLITSGKNWAVNQWKNYQVRITSGRGAGQVRAIISNTPAQLTVAAWTTTPDISSVYVIEGNSDYLYFTGNSSTVMLRYSRSANTWSSLAAAPAGTTASLHHIDREPDPSWSLESNFLNGRYLYSLRNGSGGPIYRYDLTADTWSQVVYSPNAETIDIGSTTLYVNGILYVQKNASATGYRWFKFYPSTSVMVPWTALAWSNNLLSAGQRAFATSVTGPNGLTYYHFHQVCPSGIAAVNPIFRMQEIP